MNSSYDREYYDEKGDEMQSPSPVSHGGSIVFGALATVQREFPVTPQKDEENPKRLVSIHPSQ